MASINEIKAKIEKKKNALKQMEAVKKEIKELETQLKIAEIDELAKVLNSTGIDINVLKKAIVEGNILLPDECNTGRKS